MRLYHEAKALPICFTPEGCPVEDLATDDEVTEAANTYLTAKALYRVTEDPKTQSKAFDDLSLYDIPEAHLEIEKVYARWLKNQLAKR